MKNAHANHSSHPFNLSDQLQVGLLQFADDIIILGQPNWECLWYTKSMLHGFKLSSCISVNFHKSIIIGLNVGIEFLKEAYEFLSYAISQPLFTFLGIPIGVNPRRRSMWLPVISKIKSRLSSYKWKTISL